MLERVSKTLQGFERINWTIFGIVLGVLAALWFGNPNPSEQTIGQAIQFIAGVVVTIVFMQIGELAQRDRTSEILGTYFKVRRDENLHRQMDALVEHYLTVRDQGHNMFVERAKESVEKVVNELSLLADGDLHIDSHEELLFTIEQVKNCGYRVRACSWQDKIEYWDSPEGKSYVDAQRELIESKKGRITRIFILKDHEIQAYKQILLSQASMGIAVRVAPEEGVPPDCLEAYILYDDSAVRVERLTRGFQKSATLSIDPDDVARYAREFDQMWHRSRPLAEFFPDEEKAMTGSSDQAKTTAHH